MRARLKLFEEFEPDYDTIGQTLGDVIPEPKDIEYSDFSDGRERDITYDMKELKRKLTSFYKEDYTSCNKRFFEIIEDLFMGEFVSFMDMIMRIIGKVESVDGQHLLIDGKYYDITNKKVKIHDTRL